MSRRLKFNVNLKIVILFKTLSLTFNSNLNLEWENLSKFINNMHIVLRSEIFINSFKNDFYDFLAVYWIQRESSWFLASKNAQIII